MSRCTWGKEAIDWVPTPFGRGNCPMPTIECQAEVSEDVWTAIDKHGICYETCPGYEEAITKCSNK